MRFQRVCLLLGLVLAAACSPATGATPTPLYSRVTEATLQPGSALPTPTGNVILTVQGKIGVTNAPDKIEMDVPMLESAGLVEYKVTDPFEKKLVTFRGPLMSDLLKLWQVPDSATNLNMVALNDYVVDVPISDIRQYPVLFAMQENGQYMEVATRGPAMLVYPYDNFQFDHSVYDDRWIWQIKSIEVQ